MTERHDEGVTPAHAPTRRSLVNGLGAGLVAAPALIAGTAAAQGTPPAAAPSPRPAPGGPAPATIVQGPAVLQDPRGLYPAPPYPRQEQPAPGLVSLMQPRPDHGETSYVGSGRLAGRRALITGGDSGIGRAAAIAYAREGADVAIGYLPAEESDAREVLDLIRREGRKAVAVPGDIREEAFCNRMVADAVAGLGGLDILVNNAGAQGSRGGLDEITTEAFDNVFKVNVYAPFWITKAALPHLRPGSTVIHTASVQAYNPSANLIDYAATKAALVSFTKSMSKALLPRGIRVNAVAPGPYWTPLQPSGGQPPDEVQDFGAQSPMGRPGQPREIAPLYVLLASAESSYVTGSVFGSSGGGIGP